MVKNLNFHETFTVNKAYITELLQMLKNEDSFILSKDEISKQTGIPTGKSSGKVIPHLHYAKFFDFIDFKRKEGKIYCNITPLGKLIIEEDIFLIEEITHFICHYNICRKQEYGGAYLWHSFFSTIQDFGYFFTQNDIIKNLNLTAKDLKPLNQFYNNEETSAFNLLTILNIIEDKQNGIRYEIKPLTYNIEYKNFILYSFLKAFEKEFEDKREVNEFDLFNKTKWNIPFGWDYFKSIEVLKKLQKATDAFTINAMLNPVTFIRTGESDRLLQKIYAEG